MNPMMVRTNSGAQAERWQAAAARDQRSLSDWIRLALDAAALREMVIGEIAVGSKKRGPQITFRLDSMAQKERWQVAARRAKRSLSAWTRIALDAAAQEAIAP